MLLIAIAYFLYLFAFDIRYHIYRAKNQFKDRFQRTQHINKFLEKERAGDNGNQVLFIFCDMITACALLSNTICEKHQHKESFVVLNLILKFR